MRQKYFKVRGYIAALSAILLSLCLILGLTFAVPHAVYADEDGTESEMKQNEWLNQASITSINESGEYTAIDGWEKGLFDRDVYVFSAEAKYGGGQLYFRIYCAGEESLSAVTYAQGIALNGEMDNTAFRLGQYGHVPEYVSETLRGLDEGVYYLLAAVPEDALGEYAGLNDGYLTDEEIISRSFSFTVIPVAVTEEATLTGITIEQWTLGNFDNTINIIKAETNAGLENVTYAVFKDNGGEPDTVIISLKEFKTDANGVVVDVFTIDALKGLGAGKYWLTGTVNGDVSVSIPFYIRIQNYWEVVPSITSWNEGHFSVTDNVLYGDAKIGQVKFSICDENDNVLYTVLKDGEGAIASITNAAGESLHISVLNKLPVGSYKIIAEVESTDNFSSLRTVSYFAVFEDSVALGGIIAATVTFAVVDLIAAGLCIALLIIRRRKIENQFRNMVRKELNRR